MINLKGKEGMSGSFCFLQLTSNSVLFPHSHGTAGTFAEVVLSHDSDLPQLSARITKYLPTRPEIVIPIVNTAVPWGGMMFSTHQRNGTAALQACTGRWRVEAALVRPSFVSTSTADGGTAVNEVVEP